MVKTDQYGILEIGPETKDPDKQLGISPSPYNPSQLGKLTEAYLES
jgi:hypothetical protein